MKANEFRILLVSMVCIGKWLFYFDEALKLASEHIIPSFIRAPFQPCPVEAEHGGNNSTIFHTYNSHFLKDQHQKYCTVFSLSSLYPTQCWISHDYPSHSYECISIFIHIFHSPRSMNMLSPDHVPDKGMEIISVFNGVVKLEGILGLPLNAE